MPIIRILSSMLRAAYGPGCSELTKCSPEGLLDHVFELFVSQEAQRLQNALQTSKRVKNTLRKCKGGWEFGVCTVCDAHAVLQRDLQGRSGI